MGSLWHWRFPPEFVERFPIFVETGYGTGNGLEAAVRYPFSSLYSIEFYPKAVDHGRWKFRDDSRVHIVSGHSPTELALTVLPDLRDTEGAIFWLDAHFPGSDCFDEPFDKYPLGDIRLPLEQELDVIGRMLPSGNYCILIDDLHCWEDLPWEMGGPPDYIEDALPRHRSLDFLSPFCATHNVQIFLNYKGTALIVPRDAPQPLFIGDPTHTADAARPEGPRSVFHSRHPG